MKESFYTGLIASQIIVLRSTGKLKEAEKLEEILSQKIALNQHNHSLRMFGQRAEDKKLMDSIRTQIDNTEKAISLKIVEFMAISPFGMIDGNNLEDVIESASRNMQLLLKR